MKKIIVIFLVLISFCSCRPTKTPVDVDYPIGTTLYVMPDSTKVVASGGYCREGFIWVQYTTKLGAISEIVINKQLIYKKNSHGN